MWTLTSCLVFLAFFIFSAEAECALRRIPRCAGYQVRYSEVSELDSAKHLGSGARCCGDDWYCLSTQRCCAGGDPLTFEVYRPHSHGCCAGQVYPLGDCGCCFGNVYRRDTSICCAGRILPRKGPLEGRYGCCNDVPFRTSESFCCGQRLFPQAGLKGQIVRCCGNSIPYFYSTHHCCPDRSVVPRGTPCEPRRLGVDGNNRDDPDFPAVGRQV